MLENSVSFLQTGKPEFELFRCLDHTRRNFPRAKVRCCGPGSPANFYECANFYEYSSLKLARGSPQTIFQKAMIAQDRL